MADVRGRSWVVLLLFVGCSGSNPDRGEAGPEADAGTADATCGPLEAPDAGECPVACTGGCDADHVCTIECSGAGTCSGARIECPPDYACLVRCVGLDACDSGTIRCPDRYPCTVVCDGRDGCGDQSVACGSGTCSVQCGADPEACTGMNVHCGGGPCSASCDGASGPYEMIGCAEACSCRECS